QSLLAAVKEALALGPADLRVASSLGILGKLKHRQGERDRAQAFLERALAVREEALGPDHYGVVQGLNDLAALHYAYGQLPEARALFERALAIAEKQLSPDHVDLALALYNLSRVYFKSGDHLRAEPLLARLLDIKERTLGDDHTDVAAILTALSRVRSMAGRHDDAESMARRALAIREAGLPADDPAIAVSLELVAYFCAGRAKRMRSLADAERILGGTHGAPAGDAATPDAGDGSLDAELALLAAEERSLRERAREIRSRSGVQREPSTLERSPAPVVEEYAPPASEAAPVAECEAESDAESEAATEAATGAESEAATEAECEAATEAEPAPVSEVIPAVFDAPRMVERDAEGALSGRAAAASPPALLQWSRARWLVGGAALAIMAAGGAGFAMGRGAREPAAEQPLAALQQSSRGVIEEPQSGSLQPTGSSDEAGLSAAPPPAPVHKPARGRRARMPSRDATIPSQLQAQHMTRTMERLGKKVMSGVDVKADSIGRSLELPPPKFGQP
ncbi:MAG TPA: tetratricopeptide repeat protein, partial [Sorangium sp.]|nr:tetratricopeptide repeat protein [Sorangium sp.]